jgi:hypothetical protein
VIVNLDAAGLQLSRWGGGGCLPQVRIGGRERGSVCGGCECRPYRDEAQEVVVAWPGAAVRQ